jgi:hypothetical protein
MGGEFNEVIEIVPLATENMLAYMGANGGPVEVQSIGGEFKIGGPHLKEKLLIGWVDDHASVEMLHNSVKNGCVVDTQIINSATRIPNPVLDRLPPAPFGKFQPQLMTAESHHLLTILPRRIAIERRGKQVAAHPPSFRVPIHPLKPCRADFIFYTSARETNTTRNVIAEIPREIAREVLN